MRTSGRLSFTLIELLVVIAIIAILASLLVTSVHSALGRSRQTQCASNQRQIFAAMILYSADHDNALPWAVTQEADKSYLSSDPKPWLQDVLIPFAGGATGNLSKIFRCPEVKQAWLRNDPAACHYRYNARNAAGTMLDTIGNASQAIVLFDTAWPDWTLGDLPHEGVMICYADGHVGHTDGETFLDPANFSGDLNSLLMTNGWH